MNIENIVERLRRISELEMTEGYEPDLIRLVNARTFDMCLNNDIRCRILSLLAKGMNTAQEVANELSINRTSIYRHLDILKRSGFVTHMHGKYFVAARLFLAYDVEAGENGVAVKVYDDRGAFADKYLGFIVVYGTECRCSEPVCRDICIRAVKELAKKLEVEIRSEDPLAAFKDVISTIVARDFVAAIRRGYLVLKI